MCTHASLECSTTDPSGAQSPPKSNDRRESAVSVEVPVPVHEALEADLHWGAGPVAERSGQVSEIGAGALHISRLGGHQVALRRDPEMSPRGPR